MLKFYNLDAALGLGFIEVVLGFSYPQYGVLEVGYIQVVLKL